MYPADVDYVRVTTVEEAVTALTSKDRPTLLAGGQSLSTWLKHRTVCPGWLIDLNHIDELQDITDDGDVIRVGAMARWRTVAADARLPTAINDAVAAVGDVQVRNRGTIGGGLATADPGGDIHAALGAVGTTVEITGPNGARSAPITDVYRDAFSTTIADDEVITAIRIPPEVTRSAYLPLSFRRTDPVTLAFGLAALDGDQPQIRLSVTGYHTIPHVFVGEDLANTVAEARTLQDEQPRTSVGVPAIYRQRALTNLLDRLTDRPPTGWS